MKRLIFSLIFILTIVLIALLYNIGEKSQSTKLRPSSAVSKIQISESTKPNLEMQNSSTDDECESYLKSLSDPKFENLKNRRWSNFHIKYIDGEIYRIRYFYDDGPNGEYKKTVLYKEDETEFPLIVKVFRGFEKEELKDYFERGEVIWQEQAYEATLNKKSVYWRKINDEFVDLNVDEGLSCL